MEVVWTAWKRGLCCFVGVRGWPTVAWSSSGGDAEVHGGARVRAAQAAETRAQAAQVGVQAALR